jgi:uncharacterized protein (TIGR03435 family)
MTTRLPRVALAAAAVALSGYSVSGAQIPAPPVFEVASVKPAAADPASPMAMMPLVLPQPGGRLTARNAPLRRLVEVAYGVEDFQVLGGPAWVVSRRFDIAAKAPRADATLPDMQPMLRTLLAERFKLKAHVEQRRMPAFELVLARGDGRLGSGLKPSIAACSSLGVRCGVAPFGANGAFGMRGTGQPVSVLVRLLSQATGRPVLDKTGLTGLHDFEFSFDPEMLAARAEQAGVRLPPGVALPASDGPPLMTAIQEQLGLRLHAQDRLVDVLMIDSAELPAAD